MAGGGVVYYVRQEEPEVVTSPLQNTPTPRPISPTLSVLGEDTKTIKQAISLFYTTYLDCLKTPPPQARGKVSLYCQEHTGQTTSSFMENLTAQGTARFGGDPITCSQNPPTEVSVDTIDFESRERGTATTIVQFGSGFAQKIPVLIVKESDSWKVDMVSCPKN